MTDVPTVVVAPVPVPPKAGPWQHFRDWLKQPSTLQALGALAGGGFICYFGTFPHASEIGGALIAYAVPKLLPDNTTDAIKTRDISNALTNAALTKKIDMGEVKKVVTDFTDKA